VGFENKISNSIGSLCFSNSIGSLCFFQSNRHAQDQAFETIDAVLQRVRASIQIWIGSFFLSFKAPSYLSTRKTAIDSDIKHTLSAFSCKRISTFHRVWDCDEERCMGSSNLFFSKFDMLVRQAQQGKVYNNSLISFRSNLALKRKRRDFAYSLIYPIAFFS
jgi:hypothetical protein